ncbi:MAG TPA: hypothetical protein VIV06_12255 [Candidatus Limnocylindrales bacterium]
MRALRAAGPIIVGGVLLSGLIVLAGGAWFIKSEELVGSDRDWATVCGGFAMAFFAFMVGAASTIAATALARWFPLGRVVFAFVAIALGVYATTVALDQKPVLAPMFIVLHVVFVTAFGLVLPYRLYLTTRGRFARPMFTR